MTPMEARLQCLRLAVDTTGNPNKLQLAQTYYEFANPPEPLIVPKGTMLVDGAREIKPNSGARGAMTEAQAARPSLTKGR